MISYLNAESSSWKSVTSEKFTLHDGAHRFSFLVLSQKRSFTVVYSDGSAEIFLDFLDDYTALKYQLSESVSLHFRWF